MISTGLTLKKPRTQVKSAKDGSLAGLSLVSYRPFASWDRQGDNRFYSQGNAETGLQRKTESLCYIKNDNFTRGK